MENSINYSRNNNLRVAEGETIRELAHRHLLNKNHTTTDEELKNARIEFIDNFDIPISEFAALAEGVK